jgi:hypothetical protein
MLHVWDMILGTFAPIHVSLSVVFSCTLLMPIGRLSGDPLGPL